ncbi:MAG: hypothetical protein LRY51_11910, partial [Geovibrio sp.]|nr:hypothetical protein [Geovibrio sp.]
EMDSKLEKLVYLAEAENKETDLQTVKALYISSEGCGFFTDGTLKMGELIFLEADPSTLGAGCAFLLWVKWQAAARRSWAYWRIWNSAIWKKL